MYPDTSTAANRSRAMSTLTRDAVCGACSNAWPRATGQPVGSAGVVRHRNAILSYEALFWERATRRQGRASLLCLLRLLLAVMHRHKSAPVILISIACFGAEAYYITDAKHVLDATNDDRNPAMVFGCGGMDVANKCGDCTWVQEVVINLAVDWDNPDVDEAIIDRPPANITCYKGKIGVQTPTDDGVCTAFENREGGIFQGTDWVYLVKERYGFGSEQACQAMSEVLYPADAGLQNKQVIFQGI